MENIKIYKVLSYIGILWLIGLLVDEKNDEKLKFHVGQGMLITILSLVIVMVNSLFVSKIFMITKNNYWGMSYYQVISPLGYIIMSTLWIIPLVYSIIGIVNVLKDKETPLPLIGKLAFYK